jgi:hypothetical protein
VRLESFVIVVRGGRHCDFGASMDEVWLKFATCNSVIY